MATTLTSRVEVRVPTTFKNEPLTDFSREDNARKMRAAIEKVRGELGREYDLIIGGKRIKLAKKIQSINPCDPSQVVGVFQEAGAAEVEPAMQAALKAFESWSRTDMEERANLLFRVGNLLQEDLVTQASMGRLRRHMRVHWS